MARILNEELRMKVKFAAKLIAEGNSRRVVIEEVIKKFKMEEEPQKAAYVYNRAIKDLKEVDERYCERLRVAQRERIETVIAGAISKKDYMSATKAIEVMNKMFGLNEPDKKEVKFEDTTIRFNFANDINNDDNETVNE